ncbi:hypothetical protein GCM10010294_70000 [Streptomyces griseoloalbus]|nr:hypothetical protein GCM10010294_70000 [Streptomyces griseoloalbus]
MAAGRAVSRARRHPRRPLPGTPHLRDDDPPRLLTPEGVRPDATTVQSFPTRLTTCNLATAMNVHDPRRGTITHRITDL